MGKTLQEGRKVGSGRPRENAERKTQIWVGVRPECRDMYRALVDSGHKPAPIIEAAIMNAYRMFLDNSKL